MADEEVDSKKCDMTARQLMRALTGEFRKDAELDAYLAKQTAELREAKEKEAEEHAGEILTETATRLLEASGLPPVAKTDVFIDSVLCANDKATMVELIEQRRGLVESAKGTRVDEEPEPDMEKVGRMIKELGRAITG